MKQITYVCDECRKIIKDEKKQVNIVAYWRHEPLDNIEKFLSFSGYDKFNVCSNECLNKFILTLFVEGNLEGKHYAYLEMARL